MTFKLGFGPMSPEIIDAICNYSKNENEPLMLIASRNQIDSDSGYVMTTPELKTRLDSLPNENILVCRDHCGPYFLDAEKSLSLTDAITATKRTIASDIENGFNLIHIDTSRCDRGYDVAEELIKFCLDLNPEIRFEFGTEENVGVAAGVQKYRDDVAFARQFPNMDFVVAQTGSLVYENRQAGKFEFLIVQDLVDIANNNGVRLKEHNADYLDPEEIMVRKQAGVHAMNIAPQLGVVQTLVLHNLARYFAYDAEWNAFANLVVDGGKWAKWTDGNDSTKVRVAGHYHFNSPEYAALVEKISRHTNWDKEVYSEIESVLSLYTRYFK